MTKKVTKRRFWKIRGIPTNGKRQPNQPLATSVFQGERDMEMNDSIHATCPGVGEGEDGASLCNLLCKIRATSRRALAELVQGLSSTPT
jgi:hypothetical protein